jgi:hypothetical protein
VFRQLAFQHSRRVAAHVATSLKIVVQPVWIDTQNKSQPIFERGQVWSRKEKSSTRLTTPANIGDKSIRIHKVFNDFTGEDKIKLIVLERYRVAVEVARVRVNPILLCHLDLVRIYINARHFPSTTLPLLAPCAIGTTDIQQRPRRDGFHDGNTLLQSAFFPVIAELLTDVVFGYSLHMLTLRNAMIGTSILSYRGVRIGFALNKTWKAIMPGEIRAAAFKIQGALRASGPPKATVELVIL